MEDLNKTQIILLALLVSFVTSIATGIITTSLLEEAPVSVTQTINRVVERTIETVTPAQSTAPKEISLNKEDKALLATVDKAAKVVVRIEESPITATSTSTGILGVIVSSDGLVVTALEKIDSTKTYIAVIGEGTRLPLMLAATSSAENLAIFRIVASTESEAAGTAQ